MLKKIFVRGINSFMYAIGITTVIQLIIVVLSGEQNFTPVLPEFASRFSSIFTAIIVQNVLIGLISGAFGAGSVIMELEKIGLVTQSVLYFAFTILVWYPVGCVCFGLNKYPQTMLTMGISYTVSYIVSWVVQYRMCKRDVEQINLRLTEIKNEN